MNLFMMFLGFLVDWFVGFFCPPTILLLSFPNFLLSTTKSQPVTSDQICFQYTAFCSPALRLVLLNVHQFDFMSFTCLILCLACSIPFKPLPSWSVQLFIIGQNYKLVDRKLYWYFNTSNDKSIKKTLKVKY